MSGQLGFSDHVVVGARSRRADHLRQIAGLIDWSAIEALLRPLRRGRLGRPPYPVLVLFKALLSQRWHGLSDEVLEDALSDRLSFRRFVGLGLEEAIPDASTLCRFRCDMAAVKLGEAVFGYKLHIAVDKGSLLVRAARLTPANAADCTLGSDLVQGDETGVYAGVYADRGYDNAALRDRLAAGGIANHVMQRPNRRHRLSQDAIARNTAIGRIRGRVEGVFGTLNRSYR